MLSVKQNIGPLDRRITFQSKVIGQNVSNEDAEIGWADVVTVWASRDDKTGTETMAGDKLTGFQDASFTIRYRTGISIEMRIISDSVIYGITSIQEVGRRRFLTITAERGIEYVESAGAPFAGASFAEDFDDDD